MLSLCWVCPTRNLGQSLTFGRFRWVEAHHGRLKSGGR